MITATVRGQKLTVSETVIAADTLNYITARFVFGTSDWDGLLKIAHFSNGTNAADIELTEDCIIASDGLNLTAGKWQVTVTGHKIEGGETVKRITTTIAEITVLPSGVPSGEPVPSLPSYGEQILAEVQAAEEDVTAIANAVNNIHADAQTLPAGSSATASAEIAEDAIHLSFGIPRGDKGEKGEDGHDYVLTSQDKQDIADIVLEEDVAAAIYDTVESTPVASFPDGAAAPVVDLTAAIVPVQSGNGDPSPENIRPISGWTGMNVSHSGADTSDPTVYPISWQTESGTVYGGTLDVTTGTLTVDYAFATLTGEESWELPSYSGYFILAVGAGNSVVNDAAICSHIGENPYIGGANTQIGFRVYNRSANHAASFLFRFDSTKEQTLAQFKAYLAGQYAGGTPVQVAYKLTQGTVYHLSPVEVRTLLGQNNIWADTGDTTVTYRADTKRYIDKRIREIIAEGGN